MNKGLGRMQTKIDLPAKGVVKKFMKRRKGNNREDKGKG